MKKLKVAIIGCGLIAQERHIPAFNKIENVDLIAACDINENLAREVASKYKIPKVYSNTSEMF
ncbi:MAG: Gfo/Idh/MocA family oxidoreductase, partial [Methanobacterium sp.]|nr:Gfo/Idh/MocA family oxidoreductase [Methanobacterium sp.]